MKYGNIEALGPVSPSRAPDIILEHEVAISTDGGTATAGSWETRPLNTERRDVNSETTLSTNQFTLPVGEWYLTFQAEYFDCNDGQARLYNVTDAAEEFIGTIQNANQTNNNSGGSNGSGVFSTAGTETFRIESRVLSTQSGNGMGRGNNWGPSIFMRVEIWKI